MDVPYHVTTYSWDMHLCQVRYYGSGCAYTSRTRLYAQTCTYTHATPPTAGNSA